MTQPASERAAAALKAFAEALASVAVGITIEPSTAIYVPNGYTLHARDALRPRFDAEGRANRWLQSTMVTARLDAFQACRAASERIYSLDTAAAGD